MANTRESLALCLGCDQLGIKRVFCANPVQDPGVAVYGTVSFFEACLGMTFVPDYYPVWASDLIYRRVWTQNQVPDGLCFIKPVRRYKMYPGHVHSPGHAEPPGPYACSDLVEFGLEWRCYVTAGRVVATEVYSGDGDVPEFKLSCPPGYSGAVDLGVTGSGRIELVEAHHPYSCGWYAGLDRSKTYAEWVVSGTQYCRDLSTRSG